MNPKSDPPHILLILASLFLLAYAAYNLGIAWMDSVPENAFVSPTPTPAVTQTPDITPTPLPLFWLTPTFAPGSIQPTSEVTPSLSETPLTVTPSLEDTPIPTLANTNTPTPPVGEAYPPPETTPATTPAQPTATLPGDAYPGPETPPASPLPTFNPYPGPGTPSPTTEPALTPTPYPGPGETSIPNPTATILSDGSQPTLTPSLFPTDPNVTPGFTPIPSTSPAVDLPLLTTLPYSETQVVLNSAVNQASWSPDGSTLALATAKGLRIFDAELLQKQEVFEAGMVILSARFSSNGDRLITGGGDADIHLWDTISKSFQGSLSGHLLGVTRLDLPDFDSFLASGSDDATVRIWDFDGTNLFVFRDPVTRVVDMDVSPSGEMVAAASQQNVHIWQPQTGMLLKNIRQPAGWYTALAFSPDGQVLTTAYDGRRLEFWDTLTWARVKFIRLSSPVSVLAYSPDGIFLAAGYEDGRIQIWDVRTKLLRADLAGHPGLTSLAFDFIADRFVTSSSDGSLRLWDTSPLRASE